LHHFIEAVKGTPPDGGAFYFLVGVVLGTFVMYLIHKIRIESERSETRIARKILAIEKETHQSTRESMTRQIEMERKLRDLPRTHFPRSTDQSLN
jgi:hypothetical protein